MFVHFLSIVIRDGFRWQWKSTETYHSLLSIHIAFRLKFNAEMWNIFTSHGMWFVLSWLSNLSFCFRKYDWISNFIDITCDLEYWHWYFSYPCTYTGCDSLSSAKFIIGNSKYVFCKNLWKMITSKSPTSREFQSHVKKSYTIKDLFSCTRFVQILTFDAMNKSE